jgi:hypothetical protein
MHDKFRAVSCSQSEEEEVGTSWPRASQLVVKQSPPSKDVNTEVEGSTALENVTVLRFDSR